VTGVTGWALRFLLKLIELFRTCLGQDQSGDQPTRAAIFIDVVELFLRGQGIETHKRQAKEDADAAIERSKHLGSIEPKETGSLRSQPATSCPEARTVPGASRRSSSDTVTGNIR
jgi:hypothetical protein